MALPIPRRVRVLQLYIFHSPLRWIVPLSKVGIYFSIQFYALTKRTKSTAICWHLATVLLTHGPPCRALLAKAKNLKRLCLDRMLYGYAIPGVPLPNIVPNMDAAASGYGCKTAHFYGCDRLWESQNEINGDSNLDNKTTVRPSMA